MLSKRGSKKLSGLLSAKGGFFYLGPTIGIKEEIVQYEEKEIKKKFYPWK
jgi:hypothetical protein